MIMIIHIIIYYLIPTMSNLKVYSISFFDWKNLRR